MLLPEWVASRLLPWRSFCPLSNVMVRLLPLTSTASVSDLVPSCVLQSTTHVVVGQSSVSIAVVAAKPSHPPGLPVPHDSTLTSHLRHDLYQMSYSRLAWM